MKIDSRSTPQPLLRRTQRLLPRGRLTTERPLAHGKLPLQRGSVEGDPPVRTGPTNASTATQPPRSARSRWLSIKKGLLRQKLHRRHPECPRTSKALTGTATGFELTQDRALRKVLREPKRPVCVAKVHELPHRPARFTTGRPLVIDKAHQRHNCHTDPRHHRSTTATTSTATYLFDKAHHYKATRILTIDQNTPACPIDYRVASQLRRT
jgi:hypothetical protein